MFLDNSRYAGVDQVTVRTSDGRDVVAIRLRRLLPTSGRPYTVVGTDRLDILAHRRYGDATRSWHIADANSELDATVLTRAPGRTIRVPVR